MQENKARETFRSFSKISLPTLKQVSIDSYIPQVLTIGFFLTYSLVHLEVNFSRVKFSTKSDDAFKKHSYLFETIG